MSLVRPVIAADGNVLHGIKSIYAVDPVNFVQSGPRVGRLFTPSSSVARQTGPLSSDNVHNDCHFGRINRIIGDWVDR